MILQPTRRPALLVGAVLIVLCAATARAGDPAADLDELGVVAVEQALLDAGTLGRVMNLAAHPDDEDSGMLAFARHGRGLRTFAVYANRGEGGQNEIGPELYRELGAIREVETLRADRRIGAHAYFLGLEDFGFSKTADESFARWGGKEHVVERCVLIYRMVRPDVIFTNHDATTGHGQHRALAIAGLEAFSRAGDPTQFPEQLKDGVTPWQPTLFLERTNAGGQKPEEASAAEQASWLRYDVDVKDPIRGTTYRSQAHAALKEHASQGRWLEPDRAERTFRVMARRHEQFLPPKEDPFDPVALTRLRVFRRLAESAGGPDAAPDPGHPANALLAPDALRKPWPSWRDRDAFVEAVQVQWSKLSWMANNDADGSKLGFLKRDIEEAAARCLTASNARTGKLREWVPTKLDRTGFVADTSEMDPLSRPSDLLGMRADFAPRTRILAETDGAPRRRAQAVLSIDLMTKKDIDSEFEVLALGDDDAQTSRVAWTGKVPAGVTRGSFPLEIDLGADERVARFCLRSVQLSQTVGPSLEVRRIAAACPPGLRVGLVRSYDDTLENALTDLGVSVHELRRDDLAFRDLSRFDAIFVDIRGYLAREDLITFNDRLLDYARAGGTVVVQYQKSFEWNPDKNGGRSFAPFPLELSNARVVDETAPVTLLEPDHPLLSFPNQITPRDFDGFVHERGLYFPKPPFAPEYVALLRTNDPGEQPLDGGLLAADVGKGHWAYTSFGWYRQWRNGHEGAYRVLANLAAWGQRP